MARPLSAIHALVWLCLSAAFAGPALAADTDAPIATAPAKGPAAPAAEMTPELKTWLDDAPVPEAAPPKRKVHGVVEAGIGTNGYRRAAAAVVVPIGKDGELAVAVDQTQYGRRHFANP